MKQNYFFSKVIIAVCLITFTSISSFAQCNTFVKKKCMPKISPFTQNGQMNTSTLTSGQKTTLNLTFYSGQSYRILVCGESLLGDLTFTITDLEHKVVFDSKKNDYPDFWDFKVKSTQQFIVEVQVPQPEEKTPAATGCVSIIVGFKKG